MIREKLKNNVNLVNAYLMWSARLINNYLRGLSGDNKKINLKKQESLVILCNGPSLNKFLQKLNKYENYDYMAVNFFPNNSEWFEKLRPKYLCIIDSDYLNINNLDFQNNRMGLINSLSKADWKINLLTYSFQKLDVKSCNIQHLKINTNTIDTFEFNSFIKKMFEYNYAIPPICNVAVFALFNAIRMGYKKIFIAGLDMSFHTSIYVDKNNDVIQILKHFYGEEQINLSKKKDYIQSKGMTGLFHDWYYTFSGFECMKKYAESKNIQIYNTCIESYVDIFDKIEFEKVNNV